MRLSILIAFTLISMLCSAQYSDLKDYGFGGKVKKVTIYTYDSLNSEVKTGKIVNKDNWRTKEIREYDKNGIFQKGQTFFRSPDNPSILLSTTAVAKYANGNKTVIEYESNGAVFDSVKYTWTSDSSYRLVYYDDKGKVRNISENWLTSTYRDKAGHSTIFDSNGKKSQEFHYVNTLSKSNRIISSKRTNLITNIFKITVLQELAVDGHGNSTLVRIRFIDSSYPYKISIRYFEYY